MSPFESPSTPPVLAAELPLLDEVQLAAAAFLARYSGRTLGSYRADLRQFFQWAADVNLAPLTASRAQIEMYRRWNSGASPPRRSTGACRPSVATNRFAHIDGRITTNPAQHVRRPIVHPAAQRGMDRGELAAFLHAAERTSPMHPALAVLLGLNGLRVSEACGANIEQLGFERGHRTLQIVGKGNKPAGIPLVPRTARTINLAVGERAAGPILLRSDGRRLDTRTAYRWVRSIGARAGLDRIHPHMLRAAFICCPRCRRPAARRPTRRPPRRTTNDHRLRPATAELRPPRRLRRRRLRHQRIAT